MSPLTLAPRGPGGDSSAPETYAHTLSLGWSVMAHRLPCPSSPVGSRHLSAWLSWSCSGPRSLRLQGGTLQGAAPWKVVGQALSMAPPEGPHPLPSSVALGHWVFNATGKHESDTWNRGRAPGLPVPCKCTHGASSPHTFHDPHFQIVAPSSGNEQNLDAHSSFGKSSSCT